MPYEQHHPETITAIQGPLKLATKYKMVLLRERFVTMLQVDWPSELVKYDQRPTDMKNPSWHQSGGGVWTHSRPDPGISTPPCVLSTHLPTPLPPTARVICLAKDCDVTSVLPVAYYELATAYNPINLDPRYGVFDRPIAKHVLAAGDWEVLMRGRDFIQHRLSQFIKDILSVQPPLRPDGRSNCRNTFGKKPEEPWGCEHFVRDWWFAHSYEALTDINTFRDPLAFLKGLAEQIAALELCPNCKVWMQRLMLLERQNIWDSLGEFYGIKRDHQPGSLVTTQA